ncbi:hypothetical protein Dsin_023038 [Dipteronia sinensis]|uniref:Rx N-terminal domain-containing protein n=1 Tax=Dipteronia sinensis TaxID=43782 RepID=A0AAE0A2W9_9ROSI|nr:hypothetical protein Dsin_023038 [Dipteronia sinensis]
MVDPATYATIKSFSGILLSREGLRCLKFIYVKLRRPQFDVDATKDILNTMIAYLKDTEGREGTEGLKDRIQRVRDVAYEIEDVIEEYMLDVPEHFHTHRITQFLHKAAHSVTDRIAVHRLSSRVKAIIVKIENIKAMDPLRNFPAQRASSSHGGEQQNELEGIEKCYKNLSPNIRYCFLYFCNFPANYFVKRGKLFRLWIAEQFIENDRRNRTKEEVADEYLNELIKRNLVYVYGRRCGVSQPVRDFILDKSELKNFCTVLPRPNSTIPVEKSRRLSLHNGFTNSLRSEDLSRVRTLMTFRRDSELKAEKLLNKFRLLRVLNFEDSGLQSFPKEVVNLTLLRYLSFRNTNIYKIPGCIMKLHCLEALDLRETCVMKLPKKILKLQNLLYLLVDQRLGVDETREGVELPSGIKCLKSLRKLSLLKANEKNRRIIRELGNLIELRKLGITDLVTKDGKDLCMSIQSMEYLSSLSVTAACLDEGGFLDLDHISKPPPFLRRLSLGGRLLDIPQWISSSQRLARICLIRSKLQNSPLEFLQALPCLVELRLVDAYIGEELEFEPSCFLELRVLYLEQLYELRKVSEKSSNTLPKLVRIIFKGFRRLPKVPSRLEKLIKVE